MSYVRKGQDGSDIYLIKTGSGWECAKCKLCRTLDFYTKSLADLTAHLKEHVDAGHVIPEYVFARLFWEVFGIKVNRRS